jgi:hypothetical protein
LQIIGPGRAHKMRTQIGLGHYTAGSGFCWLGLVCGLGVWTAGLAQKLGPCGLRLLVYVVKARAGPSKLCQLIVVVTFKLTVIDLLN